MSINLRRPAAFADLGSVWLDDQSARLRQKHLQFGQHRRVNADEVLQRIAAGARAWRVSPTHIDEERSLRDRFRSATIGAIEHCSWLEERSRVTVPVDAGR